MILNHLGLHFKGPSSLDSALRSIFSSGWPYSHYRDTNAGTLFKAPQALLLELTETGDRHHTLDIGPEGLTIPCEKPERITELLIEIGFSVSDDKLVLRKSPATPPLKLTKANGNQVPLQWHVCMVIDSFQGYNDAFATKPRQGLLWDIIRTRPLKMDKSRTITFKIDAGFSMEYAIGPNGLASHGADRIYEHNAVGDTYLGSGKRSNTSHVRASTGVGSY